MILDEIILSDFGLYAGTQAITLTPSSPKKPIVLIGGLNGVGKTTLLDALQLCFFGPHAKISNRGTLGYQEYLSRSIHRGTSSSEAAIEISFRYTSEGHEERYRLRRSWRCNGRDCKESFQVFNNGVLNPILANNWASQVEAFFPANIAHLFLFDGEQIEAYASHQDSSALIGAAIQNLLGLDMVDQLQKDLLVYERRKRVENRDDPEQAEIVRIQDTVRDLRKRIDALNQERASLRTHRIDRHQRALREVEGNFRKIGGDLYDQREQIEQKWLDAKQAVMDGKAALRDLATGLSPLLLVRVLLESTVSRDRHEEECRRARSLYEVLKARDRAALRHLSTQSTDHAAIDALRDFFAADYAEWQVLGKKDTVLNISPEVREDLHSLLRSDLENMADKAVRLLERQEELKAAERHAQIEHENVPDTDIIAQISAKRDALKKAIAELETLHAAIGLDIECQKRKLERKEHTLARLIEQEAKERGTRADCTRILQHASRVRTTLGAFRRTVIKRHVHQIGHLVLESYRQLLRKSALVTRLSIDPESFSLTLFGRDGDVLSAERLSAGERQLLAIALLWGLAKASGRPLPTAIDTPLGRLDSGHRIHLVERYLPFASHQVLLLSTDEEISGEYFERLSPWIGRTYQLSYDDRTAETQIRSGYFDAGVAA